MRATSGLLRGTAAAEKKERQMFSTVSWLRRKPDAEIHKQEIRILRFVFLRRTKTSNSDAYYLKKYKYLLEYVA